MQKMIGTDQHLDQRDEAVAERLQRHACLGVEIADCSTREDREQHPEVEMAGQSFHRLVTSHAAFTHRARDAHLDDGCLGIFRFIGIRPDVLRLPFRIADVGL